MGVSEIQCDHAHCRCMNQNGLCGKFHYADCIKQGSANTYADETKIPIMTYEQIEEAVKLLGQTKANQERLHLEAIKVIATVADAIGYSLFKNESNGLVNYVLFPKYRHMGIPKLEP